MAAAIEGQTTQVPRLVVQGGPYAGLELRLEKQGHPYRIGRSAGCALVVADDDMSREHAEIEHRWDGVFARDLASKNGVLIRGERLSGERRLADGDVVEMGQTRFMLDDPRDRALCQVQNGAGQVPGTDRQDLTTTHTAIRGAAATGAGRVKPSILLVIAVVIFVGTIGLALSFLLAR